MSKTILSKSVRLVAFLLVGGQFLCTGKLNAQEFSLKPLFDEYGLTIRNQGGRGTCSVFAIVGLMEFEYAHRANRKVNLSVEYLNWASNQVTGETEDGSFFSDALDGLHKYGICEDSLFPYYAANYTKKVAPSAAALKDGWKRRKAENIWIKQWDPNTGMTEDQIQQVKAQIRSGHPVAIGFQWPKGEDRFRKFENGMMSIPPREGVFDGHSIIMVGYKEDPGARGGGYFTFRNSHGSGYGVEGYGKMPYEYLSNYANDGVSVRVAEETGKSMSIRLQELDSTKIVYDRGASADALSKWLITLDGDAVLFEASAGLGSTAPDSARVEFLILGDREIKWRSGVMKGGDEPKKLRVNLQGIHKLGLLILNKGNREIPVSPAWMDGLISFRGNVPFASDNQVIRGPEEILTPAPPEKPQIHAPKVYGVHPGSPVLYRIPCTGQRPIEFRAENLPQGLSLDPSSGIITGSIEIAGHYKTVLTAVNDKGQDQAEFTFVAGPTLALTPPMGWNSWYIYYSRVSDSIMRRAADKMIESGMADFGYQYINIDDCWAIRLNSIDPVIGGEPRNPDGSLRSNNRFPDMKALTGYIHKKGLKAGIYGTPGNKTCAGYTGSFQHESQDLRTFTEWGFDFLKYDWCSYGRLIPERTLESCKKPYQLMWDETMKINRDIVLNLCQYGMADVWKWGGSVGNCWRTTGDLGILEGSSMPPFYYIGLSTADHWEYAQPGAWNDPDYILIGWFRNALKEEEFEKTNLTPNEQYAYMTMWSMLTAPLIYSGEMSLLDPFTLNILCNHEVIGINQDILGKQARIIRKTKDELIMVKDLDDGSKAVALFQVTGDANTSNPDLVDEEAAGMSGVMKGLKDPSEHFIWDNQPKPAHVSITAEELGINKTFLVRDVWRQKDIGEFDHSYTAEVPYHGVVLIRVREK
ncbi:MAG: NPCBM/NEW2 domain-containing protein [Bacteroidales bacterium]|jgi:alpha-galactosidase